MRARCTPHGIWTDGVPDDVLACWARRVVRPGRDHFHRPKRQWWQSQFHEQLGAAATWAHDPRPPIETATADPPPLEPAPSAVEQLSRPQVVDSSEEAHMPPSDPQPALALQGQAPCSREPSPHPHLRKPAAPARLLAAAITHPMASRAGAYSRLMQPPPVREAPTQPWAKQRRGGFRPDSARCPTRSLPPAAVAMQLALCRAAPDELRSFYTRAAAVAIKTPQWQPKAAQQRWQRPLSAREYRQVPSATQHPQCRHGLVQQHRRAPKLQSTEARRVSAS